MWRGVVRTIALMLAVGWPVATADAQPVHPVDRVMVTERAALRTVTGALTATFRPVFIVETDTPDAVRVGEEHVFSVVPNVESATLPITAQWDFGDGRLADGMHVPHTFERPGTYEVTVTVSNRWSEISRSFTVVAESD